MSEQSTHECVRTSEVREAYQTLKQYGLYISSAPAIKKLNHICYAYISEYTVGSGEIDYPEVNGVLCYSFSKYKPAMIKLAPNNNL